MPRQAARCYNPAVPVPHIAITCSQHAPGDNRVYTRLTCGFAALGWRVSLLAPVRGPVPPMPAGAQFIPVEYVGGYLQRLRRAGRVLPLLKKLQPDIVLFPDPDLMAVMAEFHRRSGAVVVFDRHENFEQTGAYHARGMMDMLLGRAFAAYERFAVRRLSGVVVVFDEMRRAIPPGVPVCVAHNFPARSALEALAATPAPDTPRYTSVFIGTFRGVHGTQKLLEVARELVQHRQCKDFTLYVAGQFDPGLAEEAQQFIAVNGMEKYITINPAREPYARVLQLVGASSIGLCPLSRQVASQNYLQNKLLEFMAAGLPVIASDTGPGARIVRESGCGKLYWAEDVLQIADSIEHWLNHPAEATALGKAGQDYVFKHLVWETELTRLADWLLQLR
jgi:glycosyltransferase involved in cell wall biosynthesis